MKNARRATPVWVMGLSNTTLGLFAGYLVLPLPQMLATQGVPEGRIAAVSAACLLPGFWVFLLGPVLDVRFSRRWYATMFAVIAGAMLASSVMVRELWLLETLLVVGYAAAVMSGNALGGWLASIVTREQEGTAGAWTQVAYFVGSGLMAVLPTEMLRVMPRGVVGALLGALVVLPCCVFPWMPGEDTNARRLASESFGKFFGEVMALLRRREVWLALVLFVLPTGSFALTNMLAGVAWDYGASEAFVSRMGGAALTAAGIAGCLMVPALARRMRVLVLYFGVGITGAVFTLSLLLLPKTPVTFAVAFLGENVFQAASFTTAVAVCFDVIGRENPLAATQFGLLTAATVLPIVYMGRVDGWVYGMRHLDGTVLVDGMLSLVACILLLPLVRVIRDRPTSA